MRVSICDNTRWFRYFATSLQRPLKLQSNKRKCESDGRQGVSLIVSIAQQSCSSVHARHNFRVRIMGDTLPNVSTPGQAGWEWKASTEKWVESSGKPVFRVVPDDTKPTLRDPLSTSDPTETEHFILRPPPFNK